MARIHRSRPLMETALVVRVLKLDNDQLNYMAASPAQGGDQAVLCARVTTRAKQAIAAPQRKQLVAAGVLAADGGWETF